MKNWILQTIAKTAKNQKIGQKLAKKPKSEEHKKAISKALLGRKPSEATRERMKIAALNRKKRRRKVWTQDEREAHGHLVSHGKSIMPEKTKNKIRAKQSTSMRRHHDKRRDALRRDHGFGLLRPCREDCRHPAKHYEVVKFHAPDEPAGMTTAQADYLYSLITSPGMAPQEWLVVSFPDHQTIAWHGIKTIRGGNKHWQADDLYPRNGWINISGHVVRGESRLLKISTPGGTRYLSVIVCPHREPRPKA